ncbi:tRNA (adenosine(37)-N6)-threonylcarbamoyltransferase complex ATPase subunit type 1 TsaE [Flagellimonas algicola]|uniref:tRNA threonylcarbamoyladenosine biosynthesis protein TsaE n=1 Tax=Flagellimonas algicola TaxID=2583815 RepID=A0ABY2WP03_9FLAO|nr:tRNA (adenosine(37)-N6)-threonylcarbamoyltransferase complex ATPase subunit type 1 TsaE [Allomuricauda algicola]TMU56391.1 tRNA (adenosine(37)-N6)-threonylcarbamoyltransferase complex ATPase subunit type 1 TsaE [Allomuricauda algicola]
MKRTFQLSEIDQVAQTILDTVPHKTLLFYGEMGAGKTTLIRALVKNLDGVDEASSPTFGLVNEYHDLQGLLLGYHFDFYRIENEAEALDLGLEDYLSSEAWLFMEWPEKVSSLLPTQAVSIYLHFIDENTRSIEFSLE